MLALTYLFLKYFKHFTYYTFLKFSNLKNIHQESYGRLPLKLFGINQINSLFNETFCGDLFLYQASNLFSKKFQVSTLVEIKTQIVLQSKLLTFRKFQTRSNFQKLLKKNSLFFLPYLVGSAKITSNENI